MRASLTMLFCSIVPPKLSLNRLVGGVDAPLLGTG